MFWCKEWYSLTVSFSKWLLSYCYTLGWAILFFPPICFGKLTLLYVKHTHIGLYVQFIAELSLFFPPGVSSHYHNVLSMLLLDKVWYLWGSGWTCCVIMLVSWLSSTQYMTETILCLWKDFCGFHCKALTSFFICYWFVPVFCIY